MSDNSRSKKRVFLLPHTAVGEAVRLSARARLYHRLGYKVFVSPYSQLKSNAEAYELLFQKNPSISGELLPNPEDLVDGVRKIGSPPRRNRFNPKLLRAQDFTEEERKVQLHYHPTLIPGLEEVTILDLNISSYRLSGKRDNFGNVAEYVKRHYPDALTIIREDYNLKERPFRPLPVSVEFESIRYSTIYDYCDIASSCRKMVCLQTGSLPIACHYCPTVDCLRTEEFRAAPTDRNRLVFVDCEFEDIDVR